jgi:hypothetical protein
MVACRTGKELSAANELVDLIEVTLTITYNPIPLSHYNPQNVYVYHNKIYTIPGVHHTILTLQIHTYITIKPILYIPYQESIHTARPCGALWLVSPDTQPVAPLTLWADYQVTYL